MRRLRPAPRAPSPTANSLHQGLPPWPKRQDHPQANKPTDQRFDFVEGFWQMPGRRAGHRHRDGAASAASLRGRFPSGGAVPSGDAAGAAPARRGWAPGEEGGKDNNKRIIFNIAYFSAKCIRLSATVRSISATVAYTIWVVIGHCGPQLFQSYIVVYWYTVGHRHDFRPYQLWFVFDMIIVQYVQISLQSVILSLIITTISSNDINFFWFINRGYPLLMGINWQLIRCVVIASSVKILKHSPHQRKHSSVASV